MRELRQHIRNLLPSEALRHNNGKIFVFKDLATTDQVWIRRDSPKQLLQQPYDGPYGVMSRKDRTFVIHVNGRNVTVSIDRVKPAYLMKEDGTTSTCTSVTTADEQSHTSAATSREDAPAIMITLP